MNEREKQLVKMILDSASEYYDINFSKNVVESSALKMEDGTILSIGEALGMDEKCSYTELVEYWGSKVSYEEKEAYFDFCDKERIKACFENNEELLLYSYLTEDMTGKPVRLVFNVRLYEDTENGDLRGLAYLKRDQFSNEMIVEKYKEASDKALLLESLSVNVPGGYHRCHDSEGFPLAFMSDSFVEAVGWTREQIRDELDNKYLNIVAPEDREFFLSHEEALVRDGRVDLAYRILKRDGSRRWIQDATIKMEKNGQTYYQCTLADITDYVERLNEEKARAEASSLAKSAFLFNASHDIRTPMNAILGFAHIIEQNSDKPEVVQDSVEKIVQSGNILMTLLNDVLELSRIEQGKDEVNLLPLDMESHAQNLYEMFATEMEKAEINFLVENSIQHKYVYGDDLKLTRIAMNLLSNSKKFTPKGGTVTFGIYESDYDGEKANYCLFVRDTGIGMSKEFQKHAFEQFERETSYTESGISGSGLGLAIIKKICDLMGGECRIVSELGKGTEVTVSAPLRLARENDIIQTETMDDLDFAGKRILLVEDNEFNREIARYELEYMGFVVEEAENGSVAVDMILKSEPEYFDLVLMDVQMPVMDGYMATQEIRNIEDAKKSSIPIIAMTANAFQEDKDKCLAVGMNAHIAKPLDLNNLVEVLRIEYHKMR